MSERTYIVTYIAADGNQKTEAIVGRNHSAVERAITKQGGTVLSLDRDESEQMNVRPLRHMVMGILLAVVVAGLMIAYYWYRHR